MRLIFSIFISILIIPSAHAKDLKVLAQELMPIGGTGPDGQVAGVYAELATVPPERT